MKRTSVWAGALLTTAALVAGADEPSPRHYAEVVRRSAAMVHDPEAQRLAAQYGLQVLNVTWEDTGRFKGSAVGPNISDMTIQVAEKDPRTGKVVRITCMPVIRFPNFEDQTADLPIERFEVLVGNERGLPLRKVPLAEVLGNLRRYLSDPLSWKGTRTSLLAERDTHVLVSAQACFLPVPKEGQAEFNPVLFNYQSTADDPAVLTLLVTREGTSVTVIDNVRDGFVEGGAWGQRLFFNKAGQRASLTGQRLSDFTRQAGDATTGNPVTVGSDAQLPQGGLNQVLVIQVPLKQKNVRPPVPSAPGACFEEETCRAAGALDSDVEEAVIGHGDVEGPFTECAGLELERDERFPIRVTVQFYKATSNGVVSAADMETIAGQIRSIYEDATAVGSLVTQGETGRVTEHSGVKVEYPGWWEEFWARHEQATGRSREEALRALRDLTGEGWVPPSREALIDALERADERRKTSTNDGPTKVGAAPEARRERCVVEPPARRGGAFALAALAAAGLLLRGVRALR